MEIQNLHEPTMLGKKRDFAKKDAIILDARYTVSAVNDCISEK